MIYNTVDQRTLREYEALLLTFVSRVTPIRPGTSIFIAIAGFSPLTIPFSTVVKIAPMILPFAALISAIVSYMSFVPLAMVKVISLTCINVVKDAFKVGTKI